MKKVIAMNGRREKMDDLISRQAAIDELNEEYHGMISDESMKIYKIMEWLEERPSAQLERLADDDFETIRIHLNAYKEKLCNQHNWKEAEEYQRIIDRFMSFASAQPKNADRAEESEQNVSKLDLVSRKAAWKKTGVWVEKEVFEQKAHDIEEWQSARCSVCGKYHTTPYMYNFFDFAYCPCCGAKMEEGELYEAD